MKSLTPRSISGVRRPWGKRWRVAVAGSVLGALVAASIVGAEALVVKQAQGGNIAAVKAVAGSDGTSTSSTT